MGNHVDWGEGAVEPVAVVIFGGGVSVGAGCGLGVGFCAGWAGDGAVAG